jgi:hypothetical protein
VIPFAATQNGRFNSIEKHSQPSPIQIHRLIPGDSRKNESAFFQSLVPNSVAVLIPGQYLHAIPISVAENKPVAA